MDGVGKTSGYHDNPAPRASARRPGSNSVAQQIRRLPFSSFSSENPGLSRPRVARDDRVSIPPCPGSDRGGQTHAAIGGPRSSGRDGVLTGAARRLVPLGRLCLALRRHDDQLHRSGRPGRARPRPPAGDGLDRYSVWRHQRCLLARLRARIPAPRLADRPPRHESRLCRGPGRLVAGGGGPCAGPIGVRVRRRPLPARPGRGGQLPGRRPDDGRMVPSTRAGPGHGDLQLRIERRGRDRPADRAGHRAGGGLAGGLRDNGAPGPRLGRLLDPALRSARADFPRLARRARLDQQRPARSRGQDPLAPVAPPPADLGSRGGQVPDRPDLVVLPVLVGQVLRRSVRDRPQEDRPATDRHLLDGRRRLDRRGLALLAPDRPGLVGQLVEEDGASAPAPSA